MAPEQCGCKPYRMMPDWFSMGVILYRLIVRKGPFEPFEEEY